MVPYCLQECIGEVDGSLAKLLGQLSLSVWRMPWPVRHQTFTLQAKNTATAPWPAFDEARKIAVPIVL